ncbi:MAG: hypothetical protein RSC91_05105, partial [Clostridia bacterium]
TASPRVIVPGLIMGIPIKQPPKVDESCGSKDLTHGEQSVASLRMLGLNRMGPFLGYAQGAFR